VHVNVRPFGDGPARSIDVPDASDEADDVARELVRAARDSGERRAVELGDDALSYAELEARSRVLAGWLASRGVGGGARVAILLADGVDWVVSWYAIVRLGAIAVPVNTRYRRRELRHLLGEVEPTVLVVGGDAAQSYHDLLAAAFGLERAQLSLGAVVEHCPSVRAVLSSEEGGLPAGFDSLRGAIDGETSPGERGHGEAPLPAGPAAQSELALLYTSGTTAMPKGAVVLHGPLLANTRWVCRKMRIVASDRYLLPVPLFSASGVGTLTQCLVSRATLVLHGRFDPDGLVRTVVDGGITAMFAFDQVVDALRERLDGRAPTALRTGNGAPLSTANARYVLEDLGASGFVTVYGMSEASTAIAMAWADDPVELKLTTNGEVQPGVEVEIVDLDTGRPVPPGADGEICVRGPNVTPGYYRRPRENAEAFRADGFFCTGDIGSLRDGRLTYRGRRKDVIKPNGFNVSALEIEAAIRDAVPVVEVAVIGVPHSRLGEAAVAYLEPAGGRSITTEQLAARLHGQIATYKIPVEVVETDDWPRTPTGKIRKDALRDRWGEGRIGQLSTIPI